MSLTSMSAIPPRRRKPFTLSYDVSKPNFLDWSKKKTQIILPLVQFSLPEVDDRRHRCRRRAAQTRAERRVLLQDQAGAAGQVHRARARSRFRLKRDYAEYEATYKIENSIFTAGRKLTLHQDELPVARASDYESFRRAVGADLAQTAWRSKTLPPEASFLPPT